jgi:hypothetical protein
MWQIGAFFASKRSILQCFSAKTGETIGSNQSENRENPKAAPLLGLHETLARRQQGRGDCECRGRSD